MSQNKDISLSAKVPSSKIDFILKLLHNVCDQQGFSGIEISSQHEQHGDIVVALKWEHIEGVANEEYTYQDLENSVIQMIAKT